MIPTAIIALEKEAQAPIPTGSSIPRSKKRGDNIRVLELLCLHGANKNIMYEAHPHLGTDKLPGIISNIRKSILDAGGLFLLEKKVTDFIIEGNSDKGCSNFR